MLLMTVLIRMSEALGRYFKHAILIKFQFHVDDDKY